METIREIREGRNFYVEAGEFLKGINIDELEEKFVEYCKLHKFNRNEASYFRFMVASQVELRCSIALIKLQCDEQKTAKV